MTHDRYFRFTTSVRGPIHMFWVLIFILEVKVKSQPINLQLVAEIVYHNGILLEYHQEYIIMNINFKNQKNWSKVK